MNYKKKKNYQIKKVKKIKNILFLISPIEFKIILENINIFFN